MTNLLGLLASINLENLENYNIKEVEKQIAKNTSIVIISILLVIVLKIWF